jgi:hypothetical protein
MINSKITTGIVIEALQEVTFPRFFKTERGFQPENWGAGLKIDLGEETRPGL